MTDPYAFVVRGSACIEASADEVYDAVSDITRFGNWSPECSGGEWLTDVRGVGARFLGHNRARERTWTTECEVIAAHRPVEFRWHLLTNTTPRTSVWTFHIEARGADSVVTETFEMTATPRPFRATLDSRPAEQRAAFVDARKRELARGIEDTLAAIKAELEDAG